MNVWVVLRHEDNDEPFIEAVCDSEEAAVLAREFDRKFILGDDYRLPRDPNVEVDCPHEVECDCYTDDDDYDYEHSGHTWSIVDRPLMSLTDYQGK